MGRVLKTEPTSLRAHVRDHRGREVLPTIEASYPGFVLTESRRASTEDALHLALEVSYGQAARAAEVGDHAAAIYDLGPEPKDDDPRDPAVVAWADDRFFLFLASDEMPVQRLVEIADGLYG